MHKFFNTLSRNLIFIIPVSMSLGAIYGLTFPVEFLRSLIIPAVFFIVYPIMVSLKVEEIFKGNDLKLQIVSLIINFLIIPSVAFGLGSIFFKNNPYMLLGILLISLFPAGGGAISWTGIVKGNVESVIKMAVFGPIIGAILTPFYVEFLIGPALDISLFSIIKQVTIVVIIPMFFGVLTRKLLLAKGGNRASKEKLVALFPSFASVGIMVIVFIALALQINDIISDPILFIYVLLPVLLLYIFNFTISSLIGRSFFNRGSAIALVYGASSRNISIALAIAMNLFDGRASSTVLVITAAYIIHGQLAACYSKFADRILIPNKLPKPVLLDR